MRYLYLREQWGKIGISEGQFYFRKGKAVRKIPSETIEGIVLIGNIQMTTQCIQLCLQLEIIVLFFSTYGSYHGRLGDGRSANVKRQKEQLRMSDHPEFSLSLSKKLIHGKLHNQKVHIRRLLRYKKSRQDEVNNLITSISHDEKTLSNVITFNQLLGVEGAAAKAYFSALSVLLPSECGFSIRSRQPSMDSVNGLLNFGYRLLYYELFTVIELRGLSPYVGFLHKDRRHHASLASDLMEEWRAIIIDPIIVRLVNSRSKDFSKEVFIENQGRLSLEQITLFLKQYDKSINRKQIYPNFSKKAIDFREAIHYQISYLIEAIEKKDSGCYRTLTLK